MVYLTTRTTKACHVRRLSNVGATSARQFFNTAHRYKHSSQIVINSLFQAFMQVGI